MHRLALIATLVVAKYHEGVPFRSNELYAQAGNATPCNEETALSTACRSRHWDLVRFLVTADVSKHDESTVGVLI